MTWEQIVIALVLIANAMTSVWTLARDPKYTPGAAAGYSLFAVAWGIFIAFVLSAGGFW